MQQQVDPTKLMNDFFAAVDFMMKSDLTTGKVGITGFCYGGGVANAAAVAFPELAAAVPFYGRQAPTDEVSRIKAPLLLHYAELDTRINEGWPAYEEALKRTARPTRLTSIRASITASIMIPRRVTTKRRRSSHGTGPLNGSSAIWPEVGACLPKVGTGFGIKTCLKNKQIETRSRPRF